MNERQDILQEYFSLVRDLNQTNKFKNEQTEVYFQIEEQIKEQTVLFAKIANEHKIRLCCLISSRAWIIDQNTKYIKLSEWLVMQLQDYDLRKLNLKMTFNDYFKMKFDVLLAFKG